MNYFEWFISKERFKSYHSKEYAYQIPGMNKVLQAAGRVIRGHSDKGVVLLLDQRFHSTRYQMLFPEHWSNAKRVTNTKEVSTELKQFWQK